MRKKYAVSVIQLLAAYPGRAFRMANLINHVTQGRVVSSAERNAVRRGVLRVMADLRAAGLVRVVEHAERSVSYCWQHDAPDRKEKSSGNVRHDVRQYARGHAS